MYSMYVQYIHVHAYQYIKYTWGKVIEEEKEVEEEEKKEIFFGMSN